MYCFFEVNMDDKTLDRGPMDVDRERERERERETDRQTYRGRE